MTADEVVKKVGSSLRAVREATGVELSEFSKKSGLPIDRIALIESGSYPSIGVLTLVAYAEAVDMPLTALAENITELFDQQTDILNERKKSDGKEKRTR